MKSGLAILFAASLSIQPLPQPDGPLEPSVQNEVDHAVALGERWLAARPEAAPYLGGCTNADLFATNGLTRERMAPVADLFVTVIPLEHAFGRVG